jgi:hypothetical protein
LGFTSGRFKGRDPCGGAWRGSVRKGNPRWCGSDALGVPVSLPEYEFRFIPILLAYHSYTKSLDKSIDLTNPVLCLIIITLTNKEGKMKVSKKSPIKNLLNEFREKYDLPTIEEIFTGIKLIIENANLSEVERIGKFFVELSKNPHLKERSAEEFEEWGL